MPGENNWIIEDSEEEDQLSSSQLDVHRPASPLLPEDAVSSIKTFTSIPAEKTSHISSVGADISARSTISSFPPPAPAVDVSTISEISSKSSRPRPRPIFSRAAAATPNASVSDPVLPHVPDSDHGDQFAIASHSDPTTTMTRESTPKVNPDLHNFSPDIAERAKMRARKAKKCSSPYADEVIDITDDELAVTPAQRPKERVKPRPIKSATPVENNLQLSSDPVTVPVPSSSLLLPPSDPFLESTLINSTPPRPHPPVEAATPDPSSQEIPIQPRKRKRTVRLDSPVDHPPAVPDRVTSPRSNSLPHSEGVVDVDLGQNLHSHKKTSESGYDVAETPKKRKSSKSAEKGSDSVAAKNSRAGKTKKKSIVEVVIMSPRRRRTESKKGKEKGRRNLEDNETEPRNDHPLLPPSPIEQPHSSVEDKNVHASRRQGPESDDELILAPKRHRSKVKPQKGKQKRRELNPVNSDALSEISSSNDQVARDKGQEKELRTEQHGAEGSNSPTKEKHDPRSRATELESPAPLLEKTKRNVSAQEDDPPKTSRTSETPAPGKLRYSLSRSDRKTPMQEVIRRAASHPNAPFSNSASPLAKTSKSALRRIAPLHLTRRNPPPPPPRPPPPKKSKKMLEWEEKWEMELEDEVEGWWALTDEERQYWRRTKKNKELGYED